MDKFILSSLLWLGAGVLAVDAGIEDIFIEAESGKVSGEYKMAEDESAFGGKYIDGLYKTGRLDVPFEIKTGGEYYLLHRIWSTGGLKVSVDGQEMGTLTGRPDEWHWRSLTNQLAFTLTAGRHTLSYAGGDGAYLDRIWISNGELAKQGGGRTIPSLATRPFLQHYDVTNSMGPKEYVLAYYYTEITSPEDREVNLYLGADDSIKAWLNGELVADYFSAHQGAGAGQYKCPARLKKGLNKLLLKVENGHAGWDFYFQMLDKDDGPLADLECADGLGRTSAVPVWAAVGCFPSGKDRKGYVSVYPPEDGVDLSAKYKGDNGKEIVWQKINPMYRIEPALLASLRSLQKIGALQLQACEKPGKFLIKSLLRFDDAEMGKITKNYYVDANGNDENPGTEAKPWKTFKKAAEALQPGEAAVFRPGAYSGVEFKCSGKAGAYLHFLAGAPTGVVVSGFTFPDANSSFIHVKGFQVKGGGINSGGGYPRHIVVEDCELTGSGNGMQMGSGVNFVLRRLNVHHNGYGAHLGIRGVGGIIGALVEDCQFDCNNEGLADDYRNNNTDGVCAEGVTQGLVLRRVRCTWSGDAGFDIKPPNVIFDSCVAAHNIHYGFKCWRGPNTMVNCVSAFNKQSGITGRLPTLINCTIYGNDEVYDASNLEKIEDAQIINCIFAQNPIRAEYTRAQNSNNLLFDAGEKALALAPFHQTFLVGGPDIFSPLNNIFAFFYTQVECPTPRKAQCYLGSDDGCALIVNGKPALVKDVKRGLAPNQDTVEFELKQGKNEILLKLFNVHENWGFCFCLGDNGRPMADAAYTDGLGRMEKFPVWAALGPFMDDEAMQAAIANTPAGQKATYQKAFLAKTYPQEKADLKAAYKGYGGREVRWEKLEWKGTDNARKVLAEMESGGNDVAKKLNGDPLFVDPAKGDFRLKEKSPAIGAGKAEDAPAKDIGGVERGKRIDIGAYQFGAKDWIFIPSSTNYPFGK